MLSRMKKISYFLTGSEFVESNDNKETQTISSKIFSYLFFLIFLIIGLGNWTDSKALFVEIYDGFISHFTNQLEEDTINKIHVGNHLSYIEDFIGYPVVIKGSNLSNKIKYRYYINHKYLLTLLTQETKISGVVVHSLDHDNLLLEKFSPNIPFTDFKIKQNTIADVMPKSNNFLFDFHNIAYFMKHKQLSSKGMYLYLSTGFTELGNDNFKGDIKSGLANLERNIQLSDHKASTPILDKLATQKASFFATSDLEPEFIADALLTRYEFTAYF